MRPALCGTEVGQATTVAIEVRRQQRVNNVQGLEQHAGIERYRYILVELHKVLDKSAPCRRQEIRRAPYARVGSR